MRVRAGYTYKRKDGEVEHCVTVLPDGMRDDDKCVCITVDKTGWSNQYRLDGKIDDGPVKAYDLIEEVGPIPFKYEVKVMSVGLFCLSVNIVGLSISLFLLASGNTEGGLMSLFVNLVSLSTTINLLSQGG